MRYVVALSLLAGLLYAVSGSASETSGVIIICQSDDGSLSIVTDPDDCDGTIYEVEGRLWTPPSATATGTQTATLTPTATNTPAPTPTPTATNTPTPGECNVPQGANVWHAPTDHEHGDRPPTWADAWSCQQFGHPVIFGGDEQTPMENHHKHNAFKGYSFTATADDGQAISLYMRVHMQTNPHGRIAQFHSYELYAARNGQVLGFWQGWLDFGPSPANRDSYADGKTIVQIVPQYDPANHIIGYGPGANPGYAYSQYGKEFWYAQSSTPDGWDPVVIVDVYDPSTYYSAGEETTATDMDTWQPTGTFGLDRKVTLRFIAGGSTLTTVSGQPYLDRNMLDPRGWFCAKPTGEITGMGSSDCKPGSLPQFISTQMPTIGDTRGAATYRNLFGCPACQRPN